MSTTISSTRQISGMLVCFLLFASACAAPANPGDGNAATADADTSADAIGPVLDIDATAAVTALASAVCGEAIDLLIANAGIYGTTPCGFGETDDASWEELMRVNVLAPMRFAEAFASHIARSEKRIFAAISSGMGSISEVASGGRHAYCSSKAALIMLVHNLAIDLKNRGMRTVALGPGWAKTDMGRPNAELAVQDATCGCWKASTTRSAGGTFPIQVAMLRGMSAAATC